MSDTNLSSVNTKLTNLSVKDNKNMIHIGDLALTTTASDLKELFSDCNIKNVVVKKTPNEQYAFAFITFETEEDKQKALDKYSYEKLHGKELILSSCSTQRKYTDNSNVFVNKIPLDMNAKGLLDIFKRFGDVIKCKVVRDSEGKSKGYGFVLYKSSKVAKRAVEMCQNVQIKGKTIKVELYNQDKLHRKTDTNLFTNCFCKNFPKNFNDEKLKKMLSKFGNITSVYMPMKEDQTPVGFACVNFERSEDAANAIKECHGKILFSPKEMDTDPKFAVEPFYIQKNEKKTEREQVLKGLHGNTAGVRSKLKRNLFIKNVPNTFSEDETLKVLKDFGEITDFKLCNDQTNTGKQFGFVCYSTIEEAALALEKSKKILLDGLQLELSVYKSKYERDAEGGSFDLNNTADVKNEEKKLLGSLFDLLLIKADDFQGSFDKVGVKTNKDFADVILKRISGERIDVLRNFVKNPAKLNEFISNLIQNKSF